MPTASFNIGRDCKVVLVYNSLTINLSLVTGFDAKQKTKNLMVDPLNGPPIGADVPGGWDFSFEVERGNSAIDDLISGIEIGYWAGSILTTGQVFQYVEETDGSTSTYQFDGATLRLSNAGMWKQDATVKQTLEGFASTRRRI